MGTIAGNTTMKGEAKAMPLIAPMENGMNLSEHVILLEATKEVQKNKVDVGTAGNKDMSRQIVQPNNNHMKRMGAASIQTMLYAAAGETVEKHRVENTTVHKWCNMHLAPTDNNEASRSQTWYVDLDTSNHMTSQKQWFERLEKIERPDYVEMGHNMTHSIEHIGRIPIFVKEGKAKYMENVIHVLNIAKNLIFVGQMVEQGMKVKFNESDALLKRMDVGSRC